MAIQAKIDSLLAQRKADAILIYVTSDKNPPQLFSTKMATDVIPIIEKHLYKIGKKNKLLLYLYTVGGSLEAPWPVVSLLREYCKDLEVIIPSKALSAGTLLALGADRILMTPLSFLSPVDPQGSYMVGGQLKNIQVEDISGFVDFVKNKINVNEQSALSEVVKILSSEIPPSILGSVNRTHALVRALARKMLGIHKRKLEEHQMATIVENLTEKLYSHQHFISRHEAKNKVGFKRLIEYASRQEEKVIKDIFNAIDKDMEISKSFNPIEILGEQTEKTFTLKRALIKSFAGEDAYLTNYTIRKVENPQQPFNVNSNEIGWTEIKQGIMVQ